MAREGLKAIVALALLVAVFGAVIQVEAWNAEPVAQESMRGIAEGLFDTHVIAFLVLSVLLTGALFGALYLGMPSPDEDDEEDSA